jgi:hypothetical protein
MELMDFFFEPCRSVACVILDRKESHKMAEVYRKLVKASMSRKMLQRPRNQKNSTCKAAEFMPHPG